MAANCSVPARDDEDPVSDIRLHGLRGGRRLYEVRSESTSARVPDLGALIFELQLTDQVDGMVGRRAAGAAQIDEAHVVLWELQRQGPTKTPEGGLLGDGARAVLLEQLAIGGHDPELQTGAPLQSIP